VSGKVVAHASHHGRLTAGPASPCRPPRPAAPAARLSRTAWLAHHRPASRSSRRPAQSHRLARSPPSSVPQLPPPGSVAPLGPLTTVRRPAAPAARLSRTAWLAHHRPASRSSRRPAQSHRLAHSPPGQLPAAGRLVPLSRTAWPAHSLSGVPQLPPPGSVAPLGSLTTVRRPAAPAARINRTAWLAHHRLASRSSRRPAQSHRAARSPPGQRSAAGRLVLQLPPPGSVAPCGSLTTVRRPAATRLVPQLPPPGSVAPLGSLTTGPASRCRPPRPAQPHRLARSLAVRRPAAPAARLSCTAWPAHRRAGVPHLPPPGSAAPLGPLTAVWRSAAGRLVSRAASAARLSRTASRRPHPPPPIPHPPPPGPPCPQGMARRTTCTSSGTLTAPRRR
jgi:hypothetical protein